jgi:hypothetical protein
MLVRAVEQGCTVPGLCYQTPVFTAEILRPQNPTYCLSKRNYVRRADLLRLNSAKNFEVRELEWMYRATDRPTDRLIDRSTDRLTDRPTDRLTDRPNDRPLHTQNIRIVTHINSVKFLKFVDTKTNSGQN